MEIIQVWVSQEGLLESQGGILGTRNAATHGLALTVDLPKRKDQMYAACHSCHQQRTIDDHRESRPVWCVSWSRKLSWESRAHSKRCEGLASKDRDRDSLICH